VQHSPLGNAEKQEEWNACLEVLGSLLAPDVIQKWIKPLKLKGVEESEWVFEAPDATAVKQLSKAYQGLIQHTFAQVHGKDIQLKFQEPVKPKIALDARRSFTSIPDMGLNPEYTFDEFVVGNNSQFAFSAAMAVAKEVGGTQFNPLLIYGGSGLGKTHLLQAIGNYVLLNGSTKRVRYVTSETFYREFVDSIQHNQITELSNYYRNEVDLLLMDDVQFLAGKDRTQEEFFHIFNALHQVNKQIVLTSDNPPNQLDGLEDRLVSRFQWGLFVDVQAPDRETREAILMKKAKNHDLEIEGDIISYLADSIEDNVRVLEGAIRQILLQTSLSHETATLELARDIVSRTVVGRKKKNVSADNITERVADYFAVEVNKILERGRGTKEVAQARQVAMFLMKELTSSSLKTIGKRFGDRDHSTVVHAIKTIEKTMGKDNAFKKNVDHIMAQLDR
jgi:chromosomal replication initiator protein